MYRIAFDAGNRILNLELEGFWTLGTLALFGAEMLIKTMPLRGSGFAILSDSTRFPVQSAAVASGLEKLTAKGRTVSLGPCAIVVGSMLNKYQAERTLKDDQTRVFLSMAEARAWLDLVWAPARPA